jgi:spoIIIJ-associated protein
MRGDRVNSRTTEATAPTVGAALAAGIARLLDCDPAEVEVEVRGPGLDALEGRIRLELDIAPEPEPVASADAQAEATGTDEGVEPEPVAVDGDDDGDEENGDDAEAEADVASLDEEADAGADFLEGLLDALDLPGDLRIRAEGDHAVVEIVDVGSGALIGRRGQTLEAIQELLRCALQREFQRRARVMVDVEGYRARRLEKLIEKTEEAIDAVLDTGEPERLEPMDVFERKAVHHLVAEVDGLSSRSQGREPARRVVIERD